MLKNISSAEKDYITEGCSEGIRLDGRGLYDFRVMSVEGDIFPHCNGSCRISIGNSVDILCSIKVFCILYYICFYSHLICIYSMHVICIIADSV
jgi:exosome complex RNA-binding protein Rrp42 (RNase PH superfamily)